MNLAPLPPSWMVDAPCRGVPARLYFPTRGEHLPAAVLDACALCPVAADCLTFAMVEGVRHGIWGGLGERSRRTLRRTGEFHSAAVSVLYDRDDHAVVIDWHKPPPVTLDEARAALHALQAAPDDERTSDDDAA